MFPDCWEVQKKNRNGLKQKNNVCSLRLSAHTKDNRILKERGKKTHTSQQTKPWLVASPKPAAFTPTIEKPQVNLNPFCFLTLGLEQGHPIAPYHEVHVTCGVKYNRLAVSVWIPVTFEHLASFYDVVLGSVCLWSSHQKKYPAVKRRNTTKVSPPKAQMLLLCDVQRVKKKQNPCPFKSKSD